MEELHAGCLARNLYTPSHPIAFNPVHTRTLHTSFRLQSPPYNSFQAARPTMIRFQAYRPRQALTAKLLASLFDQRTAGPASMTCEVMSNCHQSAPWLQRYGAWHTRRIGRERSRCCRTSGMPLRVRRCCAPKSEDEHNTLEGISTVRCAPCICRKSLAPYRRRRCA